MSTVNLNVFFISFYAPPLRGVASVKHEELFCFLKADSSYPDYIFHEITPRTLFSLFFRKYPTHSDQNNLSNSRSKKSFIFSPFRLIAKYLSHFIFSLFVCLRLFYLCIYSLISNTSESFVFIFSSPPFSLLLPAFLASKLFRNSKVKFIYRDLFFNHHRHSHSKFKALLKPFFVFLSNGLSTIFSVSPGLCHQLRIDFPRSNILLLPHCVKHRYSFDYLKHIFTSKLSDISSSRLSSDETLRIALVGTVYPEYNCIKLLSSFLQYTSASIDCYGLNCISYIDHNYFSSNPRINILPYLPDKQLANLLSSYDFILFLAWPSPEVLGAKFSRLFSLGVPIISLCNSVNIHPDILSSGCSLVFTPSELLTKESFLQSYESQITCLAPSDSYYNSVSLSRIFPLLSQ